jgi:hypothetical protein
MIFAPDQYHAMRDRRYWLNVVFVDLKLRYSSRDCNKPIHKQNLGNDDDLP